MFHIRIPFLYANTFQIVLDTTEFAVEIRAIFFKLLNRDIGSLLTLPLVFENVL
jgi:hypothetical protein